MAGIRSVNVATQPASFDTVDSNKTKTLSGDMMASHPARSPEQAAALPQTYARVIGQQDQPLIDHQLQRLFPHLRVKQPVIDRANPTIDAKLGRTWPRCCGTPL